MVSFFLTLLRLVRQLGRSLSDREFRVLFLVLTTTIAGGTIFYMTVERWTFVDALYFTVMTLATVGYGDLAPTTDLSKIFTILFVLVGVGVFVGFVTKLASRGPQPRGSNRHEK